MTTKKRYCPSCGKVTNTNNKHPQECTSCGAKLVIMANPPEPKPV